MPNSKKPQLTPAIPQKPSTLIRNWELWFEIFSFMSPVDIIKMSSANRLVRSVAVLYFELKKNLFFNKDLALAEDINLTQLFANNALVRNANFITVTPQNPLPTRPHYALASQTTVLAQLQKHYAGKKTCRSLTDTLQYNKHIALYVAICSNHHALFLALRELYRQSDSPTLLSDSLSRDQHLAFTHTVHNNKLSMARLLIDAYLDCGQDLLQEALENDGHALLRMSAEKNNREMLQVLIGAYKAVGELATAANILNEFYGNKFQAIVNEVNSRINPPQFKLIPLRQLGLARPIASAAPSNRSQNNNGYSTQLRWNPPGQKTPANQQGNNNASNNTAPATQLAPHHATVRRQRNS